MNHLIHAIVLLAAAAGLALLAVIRARWADRWLLPGSWREELLGWLFFALVGAGAWSLGRLGVTPSGWGTLVVRVVALASVLALGTWIWGVQLREAADRTGHDWAGMAGLLLLMVGMSQMLQGDREQLVIGALFLALARLATARRWVTMQARARELIVGRLSHALRTPAAAIRSLADALAEGGVDDPDERRRFVALIRAEAQRLATGVDRLLRVGRGGATLTAQPVPLALGDWAAEVAERWRARIPSLQLVLETRAVVEADPERLDEAIDALLDNAMRYGREPIRLTVRRTSDRIEISVEDSGNGAPAAIRAHLLGKDGQPIELSAARGFGLGLWAAGQVARAHGGRLVLVGASRFVLSWPAAR